MPLHPRAFRNLIETSVRATAVDYVDSLQGLERAELMADYFEPISVRSVADAFGFTDVGVETLRGWFHGLAAGMSNTAIDAEGCFANLAGFVPSDAAAHEIRSYLDSLAAREREEPGSTAATELFRAGMPEGELRSVDYLLPSLLIVLLGGLQEPGHACGGTFLGLCSQPEQLRRVIENPALISRALTEGLRWLSPVFSGSTRVPSRDVELAGHLVQRGDTLWLAYGSANCDEEEFDDGARFDLDRPSHPHLAFGRGRHSCAGSAFAPQVGRVALEVLFEAFPEIHLDPAHDVSVWGWVFRGPKALHVRLER
jgi:cytochrome P450